ncbi:hypothetical protein [Microbulbifer magnicolonia]|uniref:hypothetical protein n=1 Tax=Microbulbifer magnicolonia TaxID=3109744 RepID=UPI002B4059C2|nr:hypothetical protein [Microbulbifer sp. GG15]
MNAMRLGYLLIALLVFQTAVAFYDSHEQLQEIATHLPPHHLDAAVGPAEIADDDRDAQSFVVAEIETPGNSGQAAPALDFCHHCCHCHGCGVAGLTVQSLPQAPFGALVFQECADFSVPAGYFSALFRPPIARV